MFEWEEQDRFSFEDSDRFEEVALSDHLLIHSLGAYTFIMLHMLRAMPAFCLLEY